MKKTITQLNDEFRTTFQGGTVVVTQGVDVLREETKNQVLLIVKEFNNFTPDNDPYGEHDFAMIEYEGNRFYWKIDYYDKSKEWGSEDPSNPLITERVLTIMCTHEY